MFSTCCVILGTLHDPHHLCSNILTILIPLHVNCCWLSCLSVLLRCCERFIISLVSFCSHLEVILTSTHSDCISTSRCDGNCATLLTASTWKTQSALVTHALVDTTHMRVTTVAFNDDPFVCSHTHTTSLHVRVVGDQDAIHVLIRVSHRSRSSPRVFTQSVCFTQ